jgi:hypothetical protein
MMIVLMSNFENESGICVFFSDSVLQRTPLPSGGQVPVPKGDKAVPMKNASNRLIVCPSRRLGAQL